MSDNLNKWSENNEPHRFDGSDVVEMNGIVRIKTYVKLSSKSAMIPKSNKIKQKRRNKSKSNVK